MKSFALALALVILASGGLAAQPDEFNQKQKALREEIEQLQKKLDALKKQEKELLDKKNQAQRKAQLEAQRKERERLAMIEAEKKAKEEAERKKHAAKVEIRGRLLKNAQGQMVIMINELNWNLSFGDKKELAASAEKLLGKGVVVTGVVVNKKSPFQGFPGNPGINPGWPNPNPGWPNRNPGWPDWDPNWERRGYPYYPFFYESPVTITVESLVAAKD